MSKKISVFTLYSFLCAVIGMILFGVVLKAEAAPLKRLENKVITSPATFFDGHLLRVNLMNVTQEVVNYDIKLIDFPTGAVVDEMNNIIVDPARGGFYDFDIPATAHIVVIITGIHNNTGEPIEWIKPGAVSVEDIYDQAGSVEKMWQDWHQDF